MPYIEKQSRKKFDKDSKKLSQKIESAGELNYVITSLLHNYVEKKGLNYNILNEVQGVMSCATFEFNRVIISPYEDKKIQENGYVSELDKKN
jgi:mRNA-degrading endonuclease YafQ of YafQ-DinJ toxin-antitoxin module